jgi:hypothetical protein
VVTPSQQCYNTLQQTKQAKHGDGVAPAAAQVHTTA